MIFFPLPWTPFRPLLPFLDPHYVGVFLPFGGFQQHLAYPKFSYFDLLPSPRPFFRTRNHSSPVPHRMRCPPPPRLPPKAPDIRGHPFLRHYFFFSPAKDLSPPSLPFVGTPPQQSKRSIVAVTNSPKAAHPSPATYSSLLCCCFASGSGEARFRCLGDFFFQRNLIFAVSFLLRGPTALRVMGAFIVLFGLSHPPPIYTDWYRSFFLRPGNGHLRVKARSHGVFSPRCVESPPFSSSELQASSGPFLKISNPHSSALLLLRDAASSLFLCFFTATPFRFFNSFFLDPSTYRFLPMRTGTSRYEFFWTG